MESPEADESLTGNHGEVDGSDAENGGMVNEPTEPEADSCEPEGQNCCEGNSGGTGADVDRSTDGGEVGNLERRNCVEDILLGEHVRENGESVDNELLVCSDWRMKKDDQDIHDVDSSDKTEDEIDTECIREGQVTGFCEETSVDSKIVGLEEAEADACFAVNSDESHKIERNQNCETDSTTDGDTVQETAPSVDENENCENNTHNGIQDCLNQVVIEEASNAVQNECRILEDEVGCVKESQSDFENLKCHQLTHSESVESYEPECDQEECRTDNQGATGIPNHSASGVSQRIDNQGATGTPNHSASDVSQRTSQGQSHSEVNDNLEVDLQGSSIESNVNVISSNSIQPQNIPLDSAVGSRLCDSEKADHQEICVQSEKYSSCTLNSSPTDCEVSIVKSGNIGDKLSSDEKNSAKSKSVEDDLLSELETELSLEDAWDSRGRSVSDTVVLNGGSVRTLNGVVVNDEQIARKIGELQSQLIQTQKEIHRWVFK